MDFIKNAVQKASDGGSSSGSNNNNNNNNNNNQGGDQNNQSQNQGGNQNNQSEDYVDKAFNFASKKAGYNVDRNTEEKITDTGREYYEKLTGNKVSDKISN